jgi:hypothetical protein
MSLTKEKIIAQTLNKYMLNIDDISRGTNAIPAAIHSAMEEYALQEMAAFAEWTSRNKWRVDTIGLWYSLDEDNDNSYTTEELIKRYYESIKE